MRIWAGLVLMGLASAQIPVAATTTVLADLVQEVGQERIQLSVVVPMGADIHTFEPRPSTVGALAKTKVLFANGLFLETFLDKLSAVLPQGASVVQLADGASGLLCITQAQRVAEQRSGSEVHRHGLCDPHLWLDPSYAKFYVQKIATVLSQIDPEGSAIYAKRASVFLAKLAEIDSKVKACIQATPKANRRLVVQHDAYLYAARYYGFSVVGSINNLSTKSFVDLAARMRQESVKIIATEPQFAAAGAAMLAEATGARVILLVSDSLTPAVPSYLKLLARNGQTLCEAFR
jgi:zinc transport system substrate-binding protein